MIELARVYDKPKPGQTSVLVDRLWPRGIAKHDAPFGQWCKEVAPSTQLRRWYGHVPERFAEFARRYREELTRPPANQALTNLRRSAAKASTLVLVTATKDVEHSAAAVLRDVLVGLGPS
jgi:uncharacterized protein YeaO (DUF488 family)